jgi:hypothetical protein
MNRKIQVAVIQVAVGVIVSLLMLDGAHAQGLFSSRYAVAPSVTVTPYDKIFRIVAWPGYGMTMKDGSRLGKNEGAVLANERLSFLFDASTTATVLTSPNCFEGDRLNTVFGNKNIPGVLGSMTVWELGFSYSSVAIPHWFEHTRYRKVTRVAAIAGGIWLSGERMRLGYHNLSIR